MNECDKCKYCNNQTYSSKLKTNITNEKGNIDRKYNNCLFYEKKQN